MTKTNLAYINDAFDNVAGADLLKWARDKSTKVIGGFRLVDEEAARKAMTTVRGDRTTFLKDREILKEKMEKEGINALAFVPRKAWDEICRRSKLLTIHPDSDGAIRISDQCVKDARNLVKKVETGLFCLFMTFAAILPTWSMYYIFNHHPGLPSWTEPDVGGFWFLMAVAAIMSCFGMMFLLAAFGGKNGDFLWFRDMMSSFLIRQWAKNSRKLGQYITTDFAGMLVPVRLPLPPVDMAEILLKAQKFALSVTAVPEAVKFVGVDKILLGENVRVSGIEEEIEATRRALRADPIVMTSYNDVLAVIVQFGDFPIEKEVIDLVAKIDYMH